jgi:ATP-dependent helicase/nuclease subunit B
VISSSNAGTWLDGPGKNADDPNIRLILGSYRSGKTDLLLKSILKHCQEHLLTETVIVVPSERYKRLLIERIFKRTKGDRKPEDDGFAIAGGIATGIAGLHLLTFYQYCQLLLSHACIFPRVLPDSVRPRIIQILLKEANHKQLLPSLAKVAGFAGTPQAILDLIDELQRAALSPQEVIERLEQSAATGAPQLDQALLYQHYWQLLDRIGCLDKHRLAFRVLEIRSKDQLRTAPGLVAFDGFDRFNPLQLQVIAASASLAEQVIVSFDYLEAERDKRLEYEWKRKTYHQMIKILGPRLQLQSLELPEGERQTATKVFAAPDRYLEMSQIAALAKEAIVKQGIRHDEILVVTRQLSEYAEAAEAAFHDAGLECFVDAPIKLSALPITRFLIALISLKECGFERARVISCLGSPYCNRKELGLTERDIFRLDAVSRDQKVINTQKQWLDALQDEPFGLKDKIAKFFQIIEHAPQFCSAYAFVEWVEDLLDQLLDISDEQREADSRQTWQLREAVSQVRGCLASLLAEENVLQSLGEKSDQSYKVHLERLTSLIEKADFRSPPFSKEAVLISGAETAPNRSYDHVYIAGLVEGEFPGRSTRGGLLTSEEILAWERYGIELHNPRFEPGFEIAVLTALKERARELVVMSAPQSDIYGDELTPAFVFVEQADSSKATRIESDYFQDQMVAPVSARSALAASAWCGKRADLESDLEVDRSNEYPLVAELSESLSEESLVARTRDVGDMQSPFNGCLKEQTRTGTLSVKLPKFFSASQLSTYGSCPHRYWLSNLVKAKLLEEPEEGLNKIEQGTAYHKAFEIFYNELISKDKSMTDLSETELEELSDFAIGECFKIFEKAPTLRIGEFWYYQKLELTFRFKQYLKRERELTEESKYRTKPVACEAAFGYDEKAPPLEILANNRQIKIRGRVDRIDEVTNSTHAKQRSFRIIDYKTGQTPITQKDQNEGTDLQLPIYALAVERSIFKGSKVAQGHYMSVHGRKSIGSLYHKRRGDEPPIDPLANAEEKVCTFVEGIEQGSFIVKPASAAECKFCDHKTICRIGELTYETENDDETY